MTRLALLCLIFSVWSGPLSAQYRGPRSADYLFAADASGARALWLNPVGLGKVDEASIMIEAMLERDVNADYPLAQYTIGFNSRGFGFGFRRDRFHVPDGDSLLSYGGNTWRVGFGRSVGALSIGAAVSLYSGPDKKQDLDIGLRYRLARGLDLAVGIEHIGQPEVRDSSLRFGGAAGLSLTALGGILGVDAEIQAHDQEGSGSYLMGYRSGIRIRTPGSLPIALTGVLELDDGWDVRRVLVGLAVGAEYLGSLVAGGREGGTNNLTTLSLLGQASRRFR